MTQNPYNSTAPQIAASILSADFSKLGAEIERIGVDLEEFRLRSLLSHPDDFRNAQLEISAGAGGTEAQDWAQMIMRMYTRWAERKGYSVEIVDLSEGEEAGVLLPPPRRPRDDATTLRFAALVEL